MYDPKNIRAQSKRHDSSVNLFGFVVGLSSPARNPVNTQQGD